MRMIRLICTEQLCLKLTVTDMHHYTGQPLTAVTPSEELDDFAGVIFYCLHAVAEGN